MYVNYVQVYTYFMRIILTRYDIESIIVDLKFKAWRSAIINPLWNFRYFPNRKVWSWSVFLWFLVMLLITNTIYNLIHVHTIIFIDYVIDISTSWLIWIQTSMTLIDLIQKFVRIFVWLKVSRSTWSNYWIYVDPKMNCIGAKTFHSFKYIYWNFEMFMMQVYILTYPGSKIRY